MFSIYQVLPEILELWGENMATDIDAKKKHPRTEREMTTPLFLLRCMEVGISVSDLDLLTVGLVLDIWTEKTNDGVKYRQLATQEDFDRF